MRTSNSKTQSAKQSFLTRVVRVLLHSKYYKLTGNWDWDLHADEIFCSDVILSISPEDSGLRSIIHPEDIHEIYEAIENELPAITAIKFRVITTYGEIRTISGKDITIEWEETATDGIVEILNSSLIEQKELESLRQQNAVYAAAEKITEAGIWYYNSATHETWHSDQVFRIHDLQPQTLNSHLFTFISFIHPDDSEQAREFIEQAYKARLPLHLEFRIVTSKSEKLIRYISTWSFNHKGEGVLNGIYQNITAEKQMEQRMETAEDAAGFHRQVFHFDEQQLHLAHWQVNLATRKLSFTDNFCRLFGFKPPLLSGIKGIADYLHPDDREDFLSALKKMFNEHTPPDGNYRVLRPDGKIRHILQKGKLVTIGNELVMTCTVHDISVRKSLEKKMHELMEKIRLQQEVRNHGESLKNCGTWVRDLTTGETTWSDGIFQLFDLKRGAVEMSEKRILLLVHPDDKKRFTDEIAMVMNSKEAKTIEFRSVDRGEKKYMKAGFKIVELDDHQYFLGQLFDITEEKSLQHTTSQRIQLAEALSENIQDKIFITDTGNNILLWNRQCENDYNIKKDQAVGKNIFDVLPALKTEEVLRIFDRVLKGESVRLFDHQLPSSNGYCNLHLMPLWSTEELEVLGIIHLIHDTTKEYELRRNLNDRLNFIESLVDASLDRIIVLDRNMRYLAWNKKCEEEFGWKKQDVLGKNVLDLFPGWQDEQAFTYFRKALAGETVHLPADTDSGRDYEVYLIPVTKDNGDIFAVLWVMHDVKLEFQLEYQKKKNLQVLDMMEENYLELDFDYRFVFLNKKAAGYFNLDPDEVYGHVIWDILPKSENTRIRESLIKAMEERIPVRGEFLAPTSNLHVFASITPTEEGVSIIFINIEEQKENELKLVEREDLINQVTYATPDCITIYDLENKEALYLNNRLSEWLGYSNHELKIMGHQGRLQLFHPDDRARMMVFNQEMNGVPDNKILTIEYTLINREGNPIRIRNRSKVFRRNQAGQAVKMLSVLQRIDTR